MRRKRVRTDVPMLGCQGARLPPRRPVPADRRPAPGDRPADGGPRPRPARPDAAGRHRDGQDVRDGADHRAHQKPTLVLAHNKTLAAQLYSEFREFFPDNAVEYFVSYFDYYQPEAYLPRSDTYIEKDSSPERGDRPAPARGHPRAVRAAGRDHRRVGVVHLRPRCAGRLRRDDPARSRSAASTGGTRCSATWSTSSTSATTPPSRGRGSASAATRSRSGRPRPRSIVRVEFFGDEVERITEIDPLTGELLAERKELNVYPATHFVTPRDKLQLAIATIEAEMEERVGQMEAEGRALEAARLRQRTTFDLEMLRELGYCTGVENYSRHLSPARARLPPVDAARLLPAGLAADRRRVAHDDPAGRRHVQERPDAQGDPRRLRLPAAVAPSTTGR